jgi:hypothetical protein
MNEVEKLRMLIPRWTEHNDGHAREYRRWAEEVPVARADLLAAVEAFNRINQVLGAALEKLGAAPGPSAFSVTGSEG